MNKRKLSKIADNDAADTKKKKKNCVVAKILPDVKENDESLIEHNLDHSMKQFKKKKESCKFVEVENNDNENAIICSEAKDDPYHLHFNKNMSKRKAEEIEDASRWISNFNTWPLLGRICSERPIVNPVIPKKLLLFEEEEDNDLPQIGIIPNPPRGASQALSNSCIQKKLILNVNPKKFSGLQSEILTIISQYIDFHYPSETREDIDKIRTVYCLHSLNHVLKARKILKTNNAKASKEDCDSEFRDQGFTRPKILILLPFKHSAYKVVKTIINLLNIEISHKKRFEDDFGPPELQPRKHYNKPDDFFTTFEGDINEDFKIGIAITKKCLKLYTDYFESDIIITSPLGLRYSLETVENENKKAFLSSIEIFIMDQADIFFMQNWEHVMVVREALNKMPNNIQSVIRDLMRVRRWCYDGLSHIYRQTLIFSATLSDYNRAIFMKLRNFAGKIQLVNPTVDGSICDVKVPAELILHRVKTDPGADRPNPDAQFEYFTKQLLPYLRMKKRSHTLIYVPDYCDYIRLVCYLKEDGGSSISTLNEYMIEEEGKVSKARGLFYRGKRNFLLYTERLHFYKRFKLKGVQHIVFYGLPSYPHFFSELCNYMEDELQNHNEPAPIDPSSIIIPYQNPFDFTKLSTILGTKRTVQIMKSDKYVHKTDVNL